jgi:hypothetical protein
VEGEAVGRDGWPCPKLDYGAGELSALGADAGEDADGGVGERGDVVEDARGAVDDRGDAVEEARY